MPCRPTLSLTRCSPCSGITAWISSSAWRSAPLSKPRCVWLSTCVGLRVCMHAFPHSLSLSLSLSCFFFLSFLSACQSLFVRVFLRPWMPMRWFVFRQFTAHPAHPSLRMPHATVQSARLCSPPNVQVPLNTQHLQRHSAVGATGAAQSSSHP